MADSGRLTLEYSGSAAAAHDTYNKVLSEVLDAQHNDRSNWATLLRRALGEVGMPLSLRWDDLQVIDLPKVNTHARSAYPRYMGRVFNCGGL